MSWAAVERHTAPFNYPRWLDAWRIRRARRFPAASATAAVAPRRLYVDVSVIARHDARTGIQRIVRALATQLHMHPPEGWEVVPVGATRKRPYHRIGWPDPHDVSQRPGPIHPRAGDVFLGLDFALDTVRFHQDQLEAFKRAGGQLWFVMYDLLPAQRPDWFSEKLVVRYRKWLGILAALADGFHCISPPVAEELRAEFARSYGLRSGFRTHVLPMGWDLAGSRPSKGLPPDFAEFLARVRGVATALMVGTLEPRKGHADVLAAFELLWRQGSPHQLVIVGRPGWKTEALQEALRTHPLRNQRLFWLEDASDEALALLYEACAGVVLGSQGEGFGLPLIEALGHGKPVLARCLPVFQLHEARGVRYFPADAHAVELAQALGTWLAEAPQLPAASAGGAIPTWADAARSLFAHHAEERS